jgi:hypothetical protein
MTVTTSSGARASSILRMLCAPAPFAGQILERRQMVPASPRPVIRPTPSADLVNRHHQREVDEHDPRDPKAKLCAA